MRVMTDVSQTRQSTPSGQENYSARGAILCKCSGWFGVLNCGGRSKQNGIVEWDLCSLQIAFICPYLQQMDAIKAKIVVQVFYIGHLRVCIISNSLDCASRYATVFSLYCNPFFLGLDSKTRRGKSQFFRFALKLHMPERTYFPRRAIANGSMFVET